MRAFHGTSADCLESILEKGIVPGFNQVWSCSRSEVYLWGADLLPDAETEEDGLREAKYLAAQNAEYALPKAKDCRRLVVECELEDDSWEEDDSCENMDGAICVPFVSPEQIVRIYRDEEDLSFYKAYFAYCLKENKLSCCLDLSRAEEMIVDLFVQNSIGICEIHEFLSDISCDMEIVYENERLCRSVQRDCLVVT